MKAIFSIITLSVIFITFSCKKIDTKPNELNTAGIDITKATSSTYFNELRIINDEDKSLTTLTENSEMFRDCDAPQLTFNKNNSYTLNYYHKVTGKLIKEIGTWSINKPTNELVMYRPLKRYNILILKMDEEDFIFSYNISTTETTTSPEGVSSSVEKITVETLYMEDND